MRFLFVLPPEGESCNTYHMWLSIIGVRNTFILLRSAWHVMPSAGKPSGHCFGACVTGSRAQGPLLVPEAQGPAPGPGTGGSDTGHRGPGARGPEARGWGPGPGPEPRGSRLGLGAGSPRHCSAIWRGSIQPCHAQPLRHLARLLFWTARSHPGRGPAVTARGGLLRRRRMRTTLSRRGWRSNQERLASARVPLVKCQAPRQRLGMKLFFRTSGLRHGRTLARVSIWVRGRPRAVSRTWAGPGCALISFDLFRSPS